MVDSPRIRSSARVLIAAALLSTCLGAAGCPGSIDPDEPRDRGIAGELAPDSGPPDALRDGAADGPLGDAQPAPDITPDAPQPDQAPTPDGPQQQYCETQVDGDTLALFSFETLLAGEFVDSSSSAYKAKLRGGALQGASGKAGCNKAAVFDGGADSYLEIDHAPPFSLALGSVDLWVRFDVAGRAGVLSKDANGTNENGHITILRACDGSIVLRKQELGNQSYMQCSAPVPNGSWVYVGVNFGQGGLELYVDGVRASRTDTIPCGSNYQCGTTTTSGLDGNQNPWVVGATAMTSADGAATPIDNPLQGAIDSLRISRIRRAF